MMEKFVDPVLEATRNVFVTMAQFEPRVGPMELKTDTLARGDVTGLIGVEGGGVHGSLAITFPKDVILDLMHRILSMDSTTIDEQALDLTGEISNMVLGGAKSLLEHQGYDLGLTLPKVLSGKDHNVNHLCQGTTLILPLFTPTSTFYVEVCFVEPQD